MASLQRSAFPLVVTALGLRQVGPGLVQFSFHPPESALGAAALLDPLEVRLGLLDLLPGICKEDEQ